MDGLSENGYKSFNLNPIYKNFDSLLEEFNQEMIEAKKGKKHGKL